MKVWSVTKPSHGQGLQLAWRNRLLWNIPSHCQSHHNTNPHYHCC